MKRRHLIPLATAGALAVPGLLPLAAQAHADTTAPVMTDLEYVQTDHGYVLKAAATGDVARIDITVTPGWLVGHSHDTTFSLTAPQPDGSYETTSPLNLPQGYYGVSAYAYAPDGTRSYMMFLGGDGMPFLTQPEFHDTTITPGQISPTSRVVGATGKLTTYDPNKGDLGTPWTGPVTLELDSGQYSTTTKVLGTNGSFSLSFTPAPNGQATQETQIKAVVTEPYWPWSVTITGASKAIPEAPLLPMRIVLDHSAGAGLVVGSTVTVSGTVQCQDATGWHPASGVLLLLDVSPGHSPGEEVNETYTGSDGRFAFTRKVPASPVTWPIEPLAANVEYLAAVNSQYTVTSVEQPVTLSLSGASVDAHSNLTFHQTATTNGAALPAGRTVLLQQSADGRTGWATIATLPATSGSHTLHVTNPHGYWRLYSPASPGYTTATSNTIHTFRYLTNITGGTPNTTHAHHGQTLTFTGRLWEQGMTGWTHFGHAKVTLLFRPVGSTSWHTVTTTQASISGSFALHATAAKSGTWAVVFTTPDTNHTNVNGPSTYVHVS